MGLQLGAKYINALGIKNLDLQLEYNRVRPFTYSHRDSVANYTHYNQPMAHPLGANFSETIGYCIINRRQNGPYLQKQCIGNKDWIPAVAVSEAIYFYQIQFRPDKVILDM
jgi:hypothetical protein